MTDSSTIDLSDLEQIIAILAGVLQGIARDALFMLKFVQQGWNWRAKLRSKNEGAKRRGHEGVP